MADAPAPPVAKGERPTLKTISRITGLAVPTVSRALNDAPDIGQETKRRVRAAAEEVGYLPNRAGVRLRTGRTNVISLVLTTEDDGMNYNSQLISSMLAALRGTAYHVVVTPYFPSDDVLRPVEYIVETRSADAVVLNQITPRDPRVAYLMARGFPFATHGRTEWLDRHAYFDFDNEAFGTLAVEALAARGRRNLIAIAPPMDQTYAMDMVRGLTGAAKSAGLQTRTLADATSDDASAVIDAALRRAIAADGPVIDGVITASTNACMVAVDAMERAGRVTGVDFDIVAKEGTDFLRRFRRPILTVREDVRDAGTSLAHAVLQMLKDPAAAPMQELRRPRGVLGARA
ncbi:MAG: LacI family transcriptional regulator [Pseudomonadota bacterium]